MTRWCHARPPTYCSLFIAFRVIDLIYVIDDSKKSRWKLNASKQTLWSNLHFSSVYLFPQNRKVSTFIDQDATQSGFFWKNIRYETTLIRERQQLISDAYDISVRHPGNPYVNYVPNWRKQLKLISFEKYSTKEAKFKKRYIIISILALLPQNHLNTPD